MALWQQRFCYLHIGTDEGVEGMLFGLVLVHNNLLNECLYVSLVSMFKLTFLLTTLQLFVLLQAFFFIYR